MLLARALNEVGEYPIIDDWPIERENDLRCAMCSARWDKRDTGSKYCPKCQNEGLTLSYRPDLTWPKIKYYVEIEGEGSASKGNDERDSFLKEQGWKGRAFENKEAKNHTTQCVATVIEDLALRRAGKTGGE